MAKTRKLIVDVIADASRFTNELDKADGYTKRLKGSMQKLGKSMAIGVGAAGAAAVAFGASALKAAEEAEQVQARVAAIIKATGGAANVTAKQIEKFAGKQQMLVGVDDEVLKKSYGILLTFKNVRNEAGKGNDIFNRTAKSLADLSAAGFGSTDSAAKAMGKALQDPIKGITALSRAGVTFSAAQKEQIKGFVEAGDLLSAQKIILAEVESQVGGTAAAGVTASEKLKIGFGEFKEQIGKQLLPVFQKLSDWFLKTGLPAIQKFFKWADKNRPIVIALAAAVGVLAVAIGVANVAMWALALNPIVLTILAIIAAVAAAVAIFVILYNKFEIVRQGAGLLGDYFKNFATNIYQSGKMLIGGLIALFTGLGDAFVATVNGIKAVGSGIAQVFSGIFNGVKSVLRFEWNALVKIVNPILRLLNKAPGLGWLPDSLPEWPNDPAGGASGSGGGSRRMLGEGGIVTRATDAIVGERGPEAIIPLDQLRINQAQPATTITINVTSSALSTPAETGAAVVDALKAYQRQRGSLPLRVA